MKQSLDDLKMTVGKDGYIWLFMGSSVEDIRPNEHLLSRYELLGVALLRADDNR